ncbi:MAG TPA: YihY/virulence factor BrkB family protein [Gaiellaceae bacterium]|jgi:membrane protein
MKIRLRRFVQLWIDLFDRHLLLDHASAIAFQVLKSTIPLTLLGLAILGASGEQRVWRKTIAPAIEPKVQHATYDAINYGVNKIFSSDSTGLIVFAAFLSLWYISGAVRAMTGALNDIYETEDDRSWPKRYAISFALAACIALGVIGALLATIILGHVRGSVEIVAQIGRWFVAIILLAISLGLLVRFAPAKHRSKKWAGAGSALVVIAWIGATLIFELFVSHVANFKTATGELTVFLVVIGYVYTSSIILMVGVELDELLREDATSGQRGVLDVLFGYSK